MLLNYVFYEKLLKAKVSSVTDRNPLHVAEQQSVRDHIIHQYKSSV